MEVEKKNNIIDAVTLNELIKAQDKVLSEVICYLWVNTINPKEPIDVIDAVEFVFSDGSKLALTGNESQEGLTFIQYNFEEEKEHIEREFEGKIKIFKVKANVTEMWKDVINTKLTKVRLTKDKESEHYLCDEIVLEFENNEMRLIQVHPLDGVIIDYYEEV
ncbi:MAG: hypothetical protein KatS3mg027_1590 [Bacteroidia bacterium]|nr:MAG: hypothetical protein KatS3mg027_1590 [Bacteroidia bacterium]